MLFSNTGVPGEPYTGRVSEEEATEPERASLIIVSDFV
jgi:hypothetical protein